MTDFETGAVETTVETETPEVTEPEEGAVEEVEAEPEETAETEESEVTEPTLPEGKKSADSAFAELRRRNAEMEAQISQYEQAQAEQAQLMRQQELEALAEELELDPEELAEAVAEQELIEAMRAENEQYRRREIDRDIEHMMRDDLAEIQSIDPNIKSFDDLPGYQEYVKGGLRGAKAYFAIMAEKEVTQPKPAKAPGQVNKTPTEKDYYTSEEIDQMSVEEIQANLEKVRRSMERF